MKNSKIITLPIIAVYAMLSIFFSSCQTDKSQKQFIIKNISKIEKVSDNSFILENIDGYYTEKTISFNSDSSFTIICWGDRNSFLWDIRKDKIITVSIPYDRFKGKNVDIDVRLVGEFKKYR